MRLHEEDYYLRKESGEPPGQWVGRLVEPLGLRGVVGEKEFRKLFDGESPTGRRSGNGDRTSDRRST